MPGQSVSPEQDGYLKRRLDALEHRIHALETQQTLVITDPTGATGDPAHGHATVIIGNLSPIAGISGFGLAAWNGTSWDHIT